MEGRGEERGGRELKVRVGGKGSAGRGAGRGAGGGKGERGRRWVCLWGVRG